MEIDDVLPLSPWSPLMILAKMKAEHLHHLPCKRPVTQR